jgi:hypothetical protein
MKCPKKPESKNIGKSVRVKQRKIEERENIINIERKTRVGCGGDRST